MMSQDTKGRTMIGTAAPVIQPRPVPGTAPLPAQHPTATPPSSAPTIGMRPRPEPSPDAAIGGAAPDIFIGQELCGYTIRRKLAEGGMGVVYEGEHRKIGRLSAIKVLKLEYCR